MALEQRLYTIEDIQALPEGQRAELIDGKIYFLAAPSRLHQEILTALLISISEHIRKAEKPCKIYPAPFAVYLNNDAEYLEPDISVICDSDKLQDDGCHGAPDLVIEIASPSTGKRDLNIKRQLYQRAGVKLYLVVMPDMESSILFDFQEDKTSFFSFADSIILPLCPGLALRISDYI